MRTGVCWRMRKQSAYYSPIEMVLASSSHHRQNLHTQHLLLHDRWFQIKWRSKRQKEAKTQWSTMMTVRRWRQAGVLEQQQPANVAKMPWFNVLCAISTIASLPLFFFRSTPPRSNMNCALCSSLFIKLIGIASRLPQNCTAQFLICYEHFYMENVF